jgi:hypothetical protein
MDKQSAPDNTKPVTEKTVAVLPGNSTTVGMGVYRSSEPEPHFDISCEPDMCDDINLTKEHLVMPGETRYLLLCHLVNTGEHNCAVTMRLKD